MDSVDGTEEEIAPMQAWADVPKWKHLLLKYGKAGDLWLDSDRSHSR